MTKLGYLALLIVLGCFVRYVMALAILDGLYLAGWWVWDRVRRRQIARGSARANEAAHAAYVQWRADRER